MAAREAGDPDPSVLLLDLRDDLARRIAKNALELRDIDSLVDDKDRDGLIPTLCFACSRPNVLRAFGKSAGVADFVRRAPPDGHFLVVVVAGGGCTFAHRRVPGPSPVPDTLPVDL